MNKHDLSVLLFSAGAFFLGLIYGQRKLYDARKDAYIDGMIHATNVAEECDPSGCLEIDRHCQAAILKVERNGIPE